MSDALITAINVALTKVHDPEIRRPITDLGMVKSVEFADGTAKIGVYLTISGCPMKDTIKKDVTEKVLTVDGVTAVEVELDTMSDEQRAELKEKIRGGVPERTIMFNTPGNRTRVYAVASGKGGVGKSTVTVNLAAALAAKGQKVGVLDADVYGFSIPRMLGVETPPTRVDDLIMPPKAHGVKVISVGMFVPGNQPVVWRGPMLHRAMNQFLADVFWGDLDVLLLDLPPGTGDIALSLAQFLPNAEILVVTTPQLAAAEVAERAGSISAQTKQRVVGVIENMSWLDLPDGSRLDVFGSGGGHVVSQRLTKSMGYDVPLMGQIPVDVEVRSAGDDGEPVVLSHPESPAGKALSAVADTLAARKRELAGIPLGLSPVKK